LRDHIGVVSCYVMLFSRINLQVIQCDRYICVIGILSTFHETDSFPVTHAYSLCGSATCLTVKFVS